jgi:phosphoglycolate phosphatase
LQHFDRPAVTDEQFAFVHMHTVDESMAYLFPDQTTLAAAYEFRKSMDYRQYLGTSPSNHTLLLCSKGCGLR